MATTLKPEFSARNGSGNGTSFSKAAVIGAGPMGAGIAAHCANAGLDVALLDLKREDADRAVERLRKGSGDVRRMQANPLDAGFYSPLFADRVQTGSSAADMTMIADADFIQEAVTERLGVKIAVFTDIIRHCKDGAYIATNTSSIPLQDILDGLDEETRALAREKNLTFSVFHWFNPPRMLRLVEIVPAKDSRPERIETLCAFARDTLGKSPQVCRDNPGFLANLVGAYALKQILNFAIENGMKAEDVDAVLNVKAGFGRMGPLAVIDLVGLDISRSVVQSLRGKLPEYAGIDRRAAAMFAEAGYDLPLLDALIAEGRLGRKSETGAGLYRMLEIKDDEGRVVEKRKQVTDLATGEYRDSEKSALESARGRKPLRDLVEADDIGGRIAWHVLKNTLVYASLVAPDVAAGVDQMDAAMRDGYEWKNGPFQIVDAFGNDHETGVAYLTRRLEEEGIEIPPLLRVAAGRDFYRTENNVKQVMGFDGVYRDLPKKPGVLDLEGVKAAADALAANEYASLWNIGDGVICAELHGPGNALGPDTMDMLNRAADLIEGSGGQYKALVIHTPKGNFAVGANLALVLIMANTLNDESIDDALYKGQMVLDRLQQGAFPVVAAPSGMALGGGCEVVMHADRIVAHPETYAGLVEVGVGVVPAWGGCKEKLRRHIAQAEADEASRDSPEMQVFTQIGTAKVSASSPDAMGLGFLNPGDRIVMNRDYLLAEAKRAALEMVPGYRPTERPTFRLGGPEMKALMDMGVDGSFKAGQATWGDIVPLTMLAHVLSGGNTTPDRELTAFDILRMEREAFMTAVTFSLEREGLTVPVMPALQRMRHILATGKPLREDSLEGITAAELRAMIRPYKIKERPDYNPCIPGSAPEAAVQAAPDGVDLKALSGPEMVDRMIHVLETDGWAPAPPSDDLKEKYNDAASGTRAYLTKKMSGLSVIAGIKGPAGVLSVAEEFLGAKIKKAEREIAGKDGDPDERRAQIEVYCHHKNAIAGMRRSLG